MVIRKKITLIGSKGKMNLDAIFDSGSTYSCIHPDIAKEIEIMIPLPEPKKFMMAKEGEVTEARSRIIIDFVLKGYTFSDEFMVVDGLSHSVIIGAKTLQAWRLKLDFENDDVIINPEVTKLWMLKNEARES